MNVFILADWDLGSFLQNSLSSFSTWGDLLIKIIGVIVLIAVAVFAGLNFLSMRQGQAKYSWFLIVIGLIVGGALLTGGFGFIKTISSGGQKTIEDLGSGLIIPWL